jgi:hypothetical protein
MPVPIVAPVIVGAGLALVAGKAAERNAPSTPPTMRVGAWGPSRGLILADVAKARAISPVGPAMIATLGKCRARGYAWGKEDAIVGKPSDPDGALKHALSLDDASFSDPKFRTECLASVVNGYLAGYATAASTYVSNVTSAPRPSGIGTPVVSRSNIALPAPAPTASRCAPPAGPGPDADAFQFGWIRAFNFVARRLPSSSSAEAAAAASDIDRDGPGRGWTPARIAELKSQVRRGYACGLANASGRMPMPVPRGVQAQNAGLEIPSWRRW